MGFLTNIPYMGEESRCQISERQAAAGEVQEARERQRERFLGSQDSALGNSLNRLYKSRKRLQLGISDGKRPISEVLLERPK